MDEETTYQNLKYKARILGLAMILSTILSIILERI